MANTTKEREIIVSKVIDAPRDIVFAAFTEREHMEKWWLPSGSKTHEIDVKPGGVWRYSQPGPDGALTPYKVKFIEIDKPALLVYDFAVDFENAKPVRTSVTLEDQNGKTNVTLHLLFATPADLENALKYGAMGGAKMALENVANYLAKLK